MSYGLDESPAGIRTALEHLRMFLQVEPQTAEQRHARWCMQYTDLWNLLNMPLLHLCPKRYLHHLIVEFALAKPLR